MLPFAAAIAVCIIYIFCRRTFVDLHFSCEGHIFAFGSRGESAIVVGCMRAVRHCMEWSEFLGLAAGACMAFSQFPQAWKVYKTGDTRSISLLMFSVLTTGVALWFVCGIVTHFWPMWLSNGICLLPSLYVLYATIRNRIQKEKPTNTNP